MSEQSATRSQPLVRTSSLVRVPRARTVAPPRRRAARWALARATCDALGLAAAAGSGIVATGVSPVWHAAAALLTLATFACVGTYLPQMRQSLTGELGRVLSTTALVTVTVGAAAMLTGDRSGGGDAMVVYWLTATALVCGGRVGMRTADRLVHDRTATRGRTLIVGAGRVGRLTAKRLQAEPQLGLRPVGFLDKDPLLGGGEHQGTPLPVLGASWDLEQVIRTHRIDHVVVAFSTAPHHVLLGIVRRCWQLGVDVRVVPRLYEVEGRRGQIEHLGGLPLVQVTASDPRSYQFALKYGLDRVAGAVMLLALAPLLALVAFAVLVTTGRPVLFRQRRVGRDGRQFDILKFRTMRGAPDRDGHANAAWAAVIAGGDLTEPPPLDDRRTPLGALLRAWSIDELPQLWNVVRGDMSLVGPRPEMPNYVALFEGAVYRYPDRHRVKSGLTGWAQINGLRGDTSLEDRIEWDNFYIENWTPWLDLKILARTLPAVLGRRAQ